MEKREYRRLNETVFTATTTGGLPVFVAVKPGYRKAFAHIATHYGGVDTAFTLDGVRQVTPAGVAHFLEHKMFDMPDGGNALQLQSSLGANPNAYTSYDTTAYHFETTQNFFENLKLLLTYVSTPCFSPDSVQKEQGIIGQEIRMYEDHPGHRVFENTLEALYAEHPVRVNIAGTVESIAEITDQTLHLCHKSFYHPSQMALCVAGDVDPERVFAMAEEILPKGKGANIDRAYGQENHTAAKSHEAVCRMSVGLPLFSQGFKCVPPKHGAESFNFDLLGHLACEALLGASSPLYARLYAEGLINQQFGAELFRFPGGVCVLAGGESRDPRAVRQAILDEAERVGREGLDAALFDRVRKAALGARLRGLDSPGTLARELVDAHFSGADYLTFPEVFDGLRVEKASAFVRDIFTVERNALSIVEPIG